MNAIVIEQNQDETRLAFEVNQSAAINRIRLARAKSCVAGDGRGSEGADHGKLQL